MSRLRLSARGRERSASNNFVGLPKGGLVYLLVPRNSHNPDVSAGRAPTRSLDVKLRLGIVFDGDSRKTILRPHRAWHGPMPAQRVVYQLTRLENEKRRIVFFDSGC